MAPDPQASTDVVTDLETPAWRKPESVGRYLRDVVIFGAILALGLLVYRHRVETGKQALEHGRAAKQLLLKDTPKAYAEAEKNLLSMLELRSNHPYAVATLGELYAVRTLDLGFDADAESARKWAARSDNLADRSNERYGAVLLGMLVDKKYSEAEAMAADISKRAAGSHIISAYGRALRAQGKLDLARAVLKKAADTEWRNPRFACDFADLYFEDGDYINAEGIYAKGVEANSDHLRSLVGRSRSQIARGHRVKDATDTLTDILGRPADQLSPRLKASALTALSELRLFEQNPDEALKRADEAIAASPAYAWAHFAKARALAAQKNAAAASSFDKAIALDGFVPDFYYRGSASMLLAGDPAKAVALLDLYLKSLKDDDRYQLTYGDLLKATGKPDEALAHYEKALALNAFNAAAHLAKGALLFDARKDLENADKEILAAIEIQETYPEAYMKRGEIGFEKKDWVLACEQYAQALIQLRMMQAPRDKLNELRDGVNQRLLKAKQRDVATLWMKETGALIR